MSYPTFPACEECERLRAEVEALEGALIMAHDDASAAEVRGWNAAIDAALSVIKLGGWTAKIERLRKPAP